jgi:NADPH:quinone reductase-like Zn-dependent oxidoreductase
MKCIQFSAYGDPATVLECVDVPEPGAPGENQVLVSVEFAPINPNDLMIPRGIYAIRPALPALIGNEGVGRVLSLGPGVQNVKVGDRVALPLSSFTWRERMLVAANGLLALPSTADPKQLAMLAANPPTAWLLLNEFVELKPGDWVLQNAANSGVGRWVIAFTKARGLRTVNIVRRQALVDELKAIGGDIVLVDSPEIPQQIQKAVGQANLRLALDGVGGPATGLLAAALSFHGTLVCYAAMSERAISINPLDVIFKLLTLRGFFIGREEFSTKAAPAIKEAAAMIATGQTHVPVAATYPLSAIKEAVAHAVRGGKVLLDIPGSSD